MRYILSVLTFIVILPHWVIAQVRVTLSESSIAPGEQTELVYSVEQPVGSLPVRLSPLPDSFRFVEIVLRKGIDSVRTGDRVVVSERYVLTSFDSGVHIIPSRRYELAGRQRRTDSVRLRVVPVVLKGEEYRDIRDIMEVEKPGRPYGYWIFTGVMVLLSAGLTFWFFRGRPRKPAMDMPPVPAFAAAMKALEQLHSQDRSTARAMRQYYGRLYDIFREYLKSVTGFSMLHLTTGELILRMKGSMSEPSFFSMAAVFRIADAVKFARYASSEKEAMDCLETVRNVIEELERKQSRS
jgi:hypothetical protein